MIPAQIGLFQGSLGSTAARRIAAAESNVAIVGSSLVSLNKGHLTAHEYDPVHLQIQPARRTIAEGIASDPPLRSGAPFSRYQQRHCIPECEPEQPPDLVRSQRPRDRFVCRTARRLSSPGAVAGREDVGHREDRPGNRPSYDLDARSRRGTTSRLIFDPAGAHVPGWSPDGRRVVFNSNKLGGIDLYVADADGTGTAQLLLRSPEQYGLLINHWPQERFLLYQVVRKGQKDLAMLSLDGEQTPGWVARFAGERGARPGLPRHQVDCLHLGRIGGARSIRAGFSWLRRQTTGVDPRWCARALAGRRQRAVLSRARWQPHGGGGGRVGGLDRDRHPASAVRHWHHGIVRRSPQSVRRHA